MKKDCENMSFKDFFNQKTNDAKNLSRGGNLKSNAFTNTMNYLEEKKAGKIGDAALLGVAVLGVAGGIVASANGYPEIAEQSYIVGSIPGVYLLAKTAVEGFLDSSDSSDSYGSSAEAEK